MKAYVIKSKKDGKYHSKYLNYDYADKDYYKHTCGTKNIINAKILKERFDTVDDFECVEITIAEGDLEHQLAEKDKEIAKLRTCEFIATILDFNKLSSDNCRLREQLAEKDKEIKELKSKLKSQKLVTDVYSTIAGSSATKMSIAKEIRHQVCEEIREKLKQIELSIENSPMFINEEYKLNLKRKAVHKNVYKVLDQIEQGENKC